MNEREILEYSDQWGIVYDKCSGYLAQVADGHLSLDDANDAIGDRMSHLPSDISNDISMLLWENWKHLNTPQQQGKTR